MQLYILQYDSKIGPAVGSLPIEASLHQEITQYSKSSKLLHDGFTRRLLYTDYASRDHAYTEVTSLAATQVDAYKHNDAISEYDQLGYPMGASGYTPDDGSECDDVLTSMERFVEKLPTHTTQQNPPHHPSIPPPPDFS